MSGMIARASYSTTSTASFLHKNLLHVQHRGGSRAYISSRNSLREFAAETRHAYSSIVSSSTSNAMAFAPSYGKLSGNSKLFSSSSLASAPTPISGLEIRKEIETTHNQEFVGNDVELALESLANADAVCFDVDSTVINEEGIDVLAEFLGKGMEVADLTASAMTGTTKFEDALEARLSLLKPSKKNIEDCLEKYPLQITEGVEELVETLINHSIDVYLVSGGFRIMIEPVAKQLCVAKSNIYANTILFDEKTGEYVGFDDKEHTSADMGKPKALQQIIDDNNYKTVVMVGDGATDAQAKPPAKAFVGFGGVICREMVRDKSDWFTCDAGDMTKIIKKYHKNSGLE